MDYQALRSPPIATPLPLPNDVENQALYLELLAELSGDECSQSTGSIIKAVKSQSITSPQQFSESVYSKLPQVKNKELFYSYLKLISLHNRDDCISIALATISNYINDKDINFKELSKLFKKETNLSTVITNLYNFLNLRGLSFYYPLFSLLLDSKREFYTQDGVVDEFLLKMLFHLCDSKKSLFHLVQYFSNPSLNNLISLSLSFVEPQKRAALNTLLYNTGTILFKAACRLVKDNPDELETVILSFLNDRNSEQTSQVILGFDIKNRSYIEVIRNIIPQHFKDTYSSLLNLLRQYTYTYTYTYYLYSYQYNQSILNYAQHPRRSEIESHIQELISIKNPTDLKSIRLVEAILSLICTPNPEALKNLRERLNTLTRILTAKTNFEVLIANCVLAGQLQTQKPWAELIPKLSAFHQNRNCLNALVLATAYYNIERVESRVLSDLCSVLSAPESHETTTLNIVKLFAKPEDTRTMELILKEEKQVNPTLSTSLKKIINLSKHLTFLDVSLASKLMSLLKELTTQQQTELNTTGINILGTLVSYADCLPKSDELHFTTEFIQSVVLHSLSTSQKDKIYYSLFIINNALVIFKIPRSAISMKLATLPKKKEFISFIHQKKNHPSTELKIQTVSSVNSPIHKKYTSNVVVSPLSEQFGEVSLQKSQTFFQSVQKELSLEALNETTLKEDKCTVLRMASALPMLKTSADNWCYAFYTFCQLIKSGKAIENSKLQQVAMLGINILSLFTMIKVRLSKTFPKVTDSVQKGMDQVIAYLSLLRRKKLTAQLQEIFNRLKITAPENTAVRDFAMPSRDFKRSDDNTARSTSNVRSDFHFSNDKLLVSKANPTSPTEPGIAFAEKFAENEEEKDLEFHDMNQTLDDELNGAELEAILKGINANDGSNDKGNEGKQNHDKKDTAKTLANTNTQLQKQITSLASQTEIQKDFGSSANDTISELEATQMDFDVSMLREQMKHCNMVEMYKQAGRRNKDNDFSHMSDIGELRNIQRTTQVEKWTYQLLVESEPLTRLISDVLKTFYIQYDALHSKTTDHHEFDWCIMVDNSGSMSSKRDQAAEALVVLIEVLRKLECRFCIVRFGSRRNQRLLKDFNEPFSYELGEKILESFTYDEGTYPATALQTAAETLWGRGPPSANQHRMMLMITDGLTQQTTLAHWKDELTRHQINLSLLLIKDDFTIPVPKNIVIYDYPKTRVSVKTPQNTQTKGKLVPLIQDGGKKVTYYLSINANTIGTYTASINDVPFPVTVEAVCSFEESFLRMVVKAGCFYILDAEDVDKLSTAIASLMSCQFKNIIEEIRSDRTGMPQVSPPVALLPTDFPTDTVPFDISTIGHLTIEKALKEGAGPLPKDLYNVSSPDSSIPHLNNQTFRGVVSPLPLLDLLSNQSLLFRQLSVSPKHKEIISSAYQSWIETEYRLKGLIQELTTVFEEVVFPINKYTRKKAHFRGSSLYLPGLIRAVITDFNYKKFFSNKSAGGKRNYSVGLVLDVSLSMNGHLANCAVESLVALIASLRNVGIENFYIVLFGEKIRILKTEDQEWNPFAVYALLSLLRFDRDFGTFDADAIHTALDLSSISSVRGPKKIFVLSDGYGTRSSLLPLALQRAEQENIKVIGLGVGFTRTYISQTYQHYIISALPSALPSAFRVVNREQMDNDTSKWEDSPLVNLGDGRSVAEIMKDHTNAFADIEKQLRGIRDLKVVKGEAATSTTVDICFCVDTTGSMEPYLQDVKSQIAGIASSLIPEIQKAYPKIKVVVNFALVPYRDIGDPGHLSKETILEFTQEEPKFLQHLRNLSSTGGVDDPEDVLGALNRVLQLNWTSKVKFLIWMGDAPSHGRECNDDPTDRYPSPPNSITTDYIVKGLVEKGIEFMFCRVKESSTKKMEKALEASFKVQAKEGFPKMISLDLFKENPQLQPKIYHFVFVLDESGSMSGEPWADLVRAYLNFKSKRLSDQVGSRDYVSVIQFNDSARSIVTSCSIASAPSSLYIGGGGTTFSPALRLASSVIQAHRIPSVPILIFMSDGGDGGGDAVATTQSIANQCKHLNLQVHTIAFGASASEKLLQNMANVAGGQFHKAIDGVSLVQTFSKIASDQQTLKHLATMVGTRLSSEIANKIVIDYL